MCTKLYCVSKVKESAVVLSLELQNRWYINNLFGKIYSKVLRVICGNKWSYVRSCQHVSVKPQKQFFVFINSSYYIIELLHFKSLKVQCFWWIIPVNSCQTVSCLIVMPCQRTILQSENSASLFESCKLTSNNVRTNDIVCLLGCKRIYLKHNQLIEITFYSITCAYLSFSSRDWTVEWLMFKYDITITLFG